MHPNIQPAKLFLLFLRSKSSKWSLLSQIFGQPGFLFMIEGDSIGKA